MQASPDEASNENIGFVMSVFCRYFYNAMQDWNWMIAVEDISNEEFNVDDPDLVFYIAVTLIRALSITASLSSWFV